MIEIIKNLPQTFFSKPFYVSLIRNGQGVGGVFILVLTIFSLISLAPNFLSAYKTSNTSLEDFFTKLPGGQIQDGKLSLDRSSPYIVNVGNNLNIEFNTDFDTDETFDIIEKMNQDKVKMLVNSNSMSMLKRDSTLQITKFTKDMNYGPINHQQWVEMGQKARTIVLPIAMGLTILGVPVLVGIKVIIGAIIAMVLSGMMATSVDFQGCVRLAAAAAIPIGFIAMLLPIPGVISFVVWLGYCIFGMLAAKKASNQHALNS